MKKTILLIPLLLLVVTWNGYSTPSIKSEIQIKKLTVVSQIIEKNYIPVEETTLVNGMNVADGTKVHKETSISKYDFSYNSAGQLTSIKSYLIENDQPTDSFLTTIEVDENNQLNSVTFGDNKMSLGLTYENGILQHTVFKDLYYKESRLSKITYNRLDLPGSIEVTSQPQSTDPQVTNFIYDPNNNVKIVNLDTTKSTYTYDKKKYALAYLPYAFNISNYLSPSQLIFTNYVPQNNIVKIESTDLITTIDYAYNAQDLPLTAKIKTIVKSNPTDEGYSYEYEFIYKTIEITE